METTNDNLIDKQLYISMQQEIRRHWYFIHQILCYALCFCPQFCFIRRCRRSVQDTMLQIWENRKTNHIDSSVHHYLFKAVKNKCYTLMNQKFSSIPNRKYTHSGHTGTIRRSWFLYYRRINTKNRKSNT